MENQIQLPVNQSIGAPVFQAEQQPQKSNFLVILLSILLFISIVIAGFFAFQTQKLVKELTVLKDKPAVIVSVEPTLIPDPTANWKTYSGKIFTFKYPAELIMKRQDIQDPSNSNNIGDMVLLSGNKIKIQVSSNFMGGWGGNPCLKTKDQIIDGHSSQILYFGKSISGSETCTDQYDGLVALIENKIFEHPYPIIIDLQKLEDNANVELELFDQILSTFKFTD